MATTLTAQIDVSGTATMVGAGADCATSDSVTVGSNNFPTLSIPYTDGTGSQKANVFWHAQRTLTAGSTDSLDLAGSLAPLLTEQGATVTFAALKFVLVAIVSPDGTKSLQVGPRAVANAAQLWFGGVGATAYEEVKNVTIRDDSYGSGWTVTAGTGDILPVKNPGAGSVTYQIWLMGT